MIAPHHRRSNLLLMLSALCACQSGQTQPSNSNDVVRELAVPVRLLADGEVMKTDWFGHSAPWLLDSDGDGDRDLYIGQYDSGVLRHYLNVGSDLQPVYEYDGHVQAGGEDASVSTFCCVGFTPFLVDWDSDGHVDVLSGSYPGQLSFFRGDAEGNLAAPVFVLGSDGEPLNPALSSTFQAVDFDQDGDLDILTSSKHDGPMVCINRGTATAPSFENFKPVLIDGEVFAVDHSAPILTDWDGDGRRDMIISRERSLPGKDYSLWTGDVLLCRNLSDDPHAPRFDTPRVLIDNHPGLRLKVHVVDYDLDGLDDLLVGDMDANCESKGFTGYTWFFRRTAVMDEASIPRNFPRLPDAKRDHLDLRLDVSPNIARRGTKAWLVLNLDIDDHWHIKPGPNFDGEESNPTTLTVLSTLKGVEFADPIFDEPNGASFDGPCLEGSLHATVQVTIAPDAELGEHTVHLTLASQACADESEGGICLPPTKTPLRATLHIVE